MNPLALAIVGCGKAAESLHLPVANRSTRVRVAALVDTVLPRAQRLAQAYEVPFAADDVRQVIGKVDAALVALPHHLHAPVTCELLRNGVHVLVEKPMALSATDCDAMLAAATAAGRVLAIGLTRRHYPAVRFVKEMIRRELLGRLRHFDLREGVIYSWDVASDFMFRRESGGGALADLGAHALDTLLWWFGEVATLDYRDDAMGGVEADCELHLTFEGGVAGTVELSRTRDLRNTCIISGERGELEVGMGFAPQVRVTLGAEADALMGHVLRNGRMDTNVRDVFLRQLEEFAGAVRDGREPLVPGREGRRSVDLIERCYAARKPRVYPWVSTALEPAR